MSAGFVNGGKDGHVGPSHSHRKGQFSNEDFIALDDPTYDDLVENISMCSGSVNEILDQVS